jgi:hypothetical protein
MALLVVGIDCNFFLAFWLEGSLDLCFVGWCTWVVEGGVGGWDINSGLRKACLLMLFYYWL